MYLFSSNSTYILKETIFVLYQNLYFKTAPTYAG